MSDRAETKLAEREADFAMVRVAECEERIRSVETQLGRRSTDR